MSPTAAPPADPSDRLATAQDEVRRAEEALGRAALDGRGEATARKALTTAQDEQAAAELACREAERREAEAEAQRAADAARAQRIRAYEWACDYLPAALRVIELRRELADAEQVVKAAGSSNLIMRARHLMQGLTPGNCGVDPEVVHAAPDPVHAAKGVQLLVVGERDPAQIENALATAKERLAQEQG